MATLTDVVNTVNQLTASLSAASNQTSKLHRQTGEFVQLLERIPEGPGRLRLDWPELVQPTIGFGRGLSLSGGYQPGVRVGPTFLNYATTFLGFGASGYETANDRVSGGPYG
jgi:hypothetical protein